MNVADLREVYSFLFWLVLGYGICYILIFVCILIKYTRERILQEGKELEREKREAEIVAARVALATEINSLVKDLTPAVELQMLDYLVNMAEKFHGTSTLLKSWEKAKPHVGKYLALENRSLVKLAWHNDDVRAVHYHLDGLRYHNGIESDYNLRITSVMCALQGNVYGAAICLLKSLIKGVPVVKNTITRYLKEDNEEVQRILSKLREFAGVNKGDIDVACELIERRENET